MLNRKHNLFLFAAASAFTFAPALLHAAPSTIVESDNFTYKYEMDVDPVTQNLDADANVDWAAHSGTFSVSGGVGTLGANSRFNGTGTSIWQTAGLNAAAEWTIEIRARIRQDSTTGATGQVWGVSTADAANTTDDLVEVGETEVHLPLTIDALNNQVFSASSPVDEFVTIRMARDADGLHVWHNNVLLNTTPSDGFNHGAVVNRLMVGTYSGRLPGPFDIDYLRLTEGAFAPIPEPASVALMGMGLLLFARRRRR